MTKRIRKIENVPTTQVLHALQRVGYNTNQAICDIIDNSIDAHREKRDEGVHDQSEDGFVRINYERAGSKSSTPLAPKALIIADNATGVSPEILEQILSMGKSEKRGKSLLGAFGVGLKTAALHLGEIITIISTTDTLENLKSVVWDVQRTMSDNSWANDYYDKPKKKHIDYYKKYVGNCTGTLVLIEKLHKDRFHTRVTPAKESLEKVCARVYRHILDEKDYLDYHFPVKIQIDGINSGKAIGPIDPLCIEEENTVVVISDGQNGFKKIIYPFPGCPYKLGIRMSHHLMGRAYGPSRDKKSNSGHGFRGFRRQGAYFLRGGREIHHETFWNLQRDLANVYVEISFDDAGTGAEHALIEVNFGKTKVNINPDLKQWLLKYHINPQLSKLTKLARDKKLIKQKVDQESLRDQLRKIDLPTEQFGTVEKSMKGKKVVSRGSEIAANIFKDPRKKGVGRKKSKLGAGLTISIDGGPIGIEFRDVSWPASPLPYDVTYTPGDEKCLIEFNQEHEILAEKLFRDENKTRVDYYLIMLTSFACSLMYEEEESRHELIMKQIYTWDLLPTPCDETAEIKIENLAPPVDLLGKEAAETKVASRLTAYEIYKQRQSSTG